MRSETWNAVWDNLFALQVEAKHDIRAMQSGMLAYGSNVNVHIEDAQAILAAAQLLADEMAFAAANFNARSPEKIHPLARLRTAAPKHNAKRRFASTPVYGVPLWRTDAPKHKHHKRAKRMK